MSWQSAWLRDSGTLVGVQVSALIATSVLAVLIARTLGPASYGAFSGVFGLAQAFGVFTQFGLSTWLLRELTALGVAESPTCPSASSRIIGALGLTGSLGFVLIVIVAAASAAAEVDLDIQGALLGLLIYTISVSIAMMLEAVFRAERKLGSVTKATFIEKGVLILLVAAALLAGGNILMITGAYVVAGASRLLFDLVRLRGSISFADATLNVGNVVRTARDAFPFAMNATVVVMIVRLDIVLIALSSTVAAGYFSVADRVLGVLVLIPVAASAAIYPHLAGEANPMAAAWSAGRKMAVLMLGPTAIGVLAAPTLIPIVFGQDFAAATHTVQLLLLVAPAAAFTNGLVAGLCSAGAERALLSRTAPIMLLGSAAVFLGVVLHGAEGAALAYIIRGLIFTGAVARLGRPTKTRRST